MTRGSTTRRFRPIAPLSVLIGAWVVSTAVQATPDGSLERPFPEPRQAAAHLVSVAWSALEKYHQGAEEPLVALSTTEAVSPDVLEAVRSAVSSEGIRQSVGGAWMQVLADVQNRLQGVEYPSAPRPELARPDIVLAVDETVAGDNLRLVRGALITLRGQDSESSGAGEIVPESATSLYVGQAPTPGTRHWLVVTGTGYCNENLPRKHWQYSAIDAAKVDALGELAHARCGANVGESRETEHQQLKRDSVTTSVDCDVTDTRVMSEHFDASSCRAVVTMTDGRLGPGAKHAAQIDWLSLVASLTVKGIVSLAGL